MNSPNGTGIHIRPVAGGEVIVEVENCYLKSNSIDVLAEEGPKFIGDLSGDVAN